MELVLDGSQAKLKEKENLDSVLGRFSFDMSFTKAYKDTNGRMHVSSVCSDTLPDYHMDKMSKEALDMMSKQLNTKKLPLLESHNNTFGYGYSDRARVVSAGKDHNGEDRYELETDFILNPQYPQSHSLYGSISSKGLDKEEYQLSIGGRVNLDDPESIDLVYDDVLKTHIRVIKKIELDHVSSTRPTYAANSRARFCSAIIKSINGIQNDSKFFKWHIPELDVKYPKTVVHFKSFQLADKSENWNITTEQINELIKTNGYETLKNISAWVDNSKEEEPKELEKYKFIHHKLINGVIKTFAGGVIESMLSMIKARSSAGLSEQEQQGVYDHLSKHFKEFNLVAPTLKELQEMSIGDYISFIEKQGFKQIPVEEKVMDELQVEKMLSDIETALGTLEKGLTSEQVGGALGKRIKKFEDAIGKFFGNFSQSIGLSKNISLSDEDINKISGVVCKNLGTAYEASQDGIAKTMVALIGMEKVEKDFKASFEKIEKQLNDSSATLLKRVEKLETVSGVPQSTPLNSQNVPGTPTQKTGGVFSGVLKLK